MSRNDRILLFSMCICASVIGGAVLTFVFQLSQEAEAVPGPALQDKIQASVKAREIKLVDTDGKVRIRLTVLEEGVPSLEFFDEDEHVQTSLDQHGLLFGLKPALIEMEGQEHAYQYAYLSENGLTVADRQKYGGKWKAYRTNIDEDRLKMDTKAGDKWVKSSEMGHYFLALRDENGANRVIAMVKEDRASVGLYNTKNQPKYWTEVDKNGTPYMTMKDSKGKQRFELLVTEQYTQFGVSDTKGKARFTAMTMDAISTLQLFDEKEKTTWEAPK